MMDLEYVRSTVRLPPSARPRKAHVIDGEDERALAFNLWCGRKVKFENAIIKDRLPTPWSLCGSCARALGATVDVEDE